MKKLMFALATAAALVGMADIESSNIVGYLEIPTPVGYSMKTATFKTVAGEGYDLTKVQVIGSDGYGDVYAQKISAAGEWCGVYYYLTVDGAGVEVDGWYKDNMGEEPLSAEEVVLAQGEALFFTSDNNELTLQVAGEVIKGDVEVKADQGYAQVGNGQPINVDLTAVKLDGSDGYGDVYIQTISEEGIWDGCYYYLTTDGAGVETNGWYKDNMGEEPVEEGETILAPGASVFLTSDNNAVIMSFPAAIAE